MLVANATSITTVVRTPPLLIPHGIEFQIELNLILSAQQWTFCLLPFFVAKSTVHKRKITRNKLTTNCASKLIFDGNVVSHSGYAQFHSNPLKKNLLHFCKDHVEL